MKSIVLIVPYIGKWPLWFGAHLVSIAQNPTVNWLFITDCKIPEHFPQNVRFIPETLESLNNKINRALEIEVPLTPRKLCDVRPAYGKIFQEYISGYDFWGFCDVDVVWGNIRRFISDTTLSENDIISSRKKSISGHFTILKNNPTINSLYVLIPSYTAMVLEEKLRRMDEEAFTELLKSHETYSKHKIWWNDHLMNNCNGKAHQEYYLDKWLWKDGKMLELKNGKPVKEVMYLHFINWKRTMKFSEIEYKDNPKQFYISYNGMHYQPHSHFAQILNGFKNLFDGYYALLYRKRIVKKIKRKFKI